MASSLKTGGLSTLAMAFFALVGAVAVCAKIAYTTLDELVRYSDLVFYGETTSHAAPLENNPYVIWFKPSSFLRSPIGLDKGDLPICDDRMIRDTIDLRRFPGAYVVFARADRRGCYAPVAGYKSLVGVVKGVAQTFNVDEEPGTQPLDAFLTKIRTLIQRGEAPPEQSLGLHQSRDGLLGTAQSLWVTLGNHSVAARTGQTD